jgi:hypothetical protein
MKLSSITPSIVNSNTIPCRVSKNAVITMPVFFERVNLGFLHNKCHIGLPVSRRTRAPKHQHVIGKFSRKSVPMLAKFPIASKLSSLDFNFPYLNKMNVQYPCAFDQVRQVTNSSHCVTDEAEFDSILHEREFEMHRHSRSPIGRIVKYAKDAVNGGHHELKILDLASIPIDPPVTIAKALPRVSLHTLSPSRDMLKVVSDRVVEENVANVMIQYNDLIDLSEFENDSFDLVISCYGLQVSHFENQYIITNFEFRLTFYLFIMPLSALRRPCSTNQ